MSLFATYKIKALSIRNLFQKRQPHQKELSCLYFCIFFFRFVGTLFPVIFYNIFPRRWYPISGSDDRVMIHNEHCYIIYYHLHVLGNLDKLTCIVWKVTYVLKTKLPL